MCYQKWYSFLCTYIKFLYAHAWHRKHFATRKNIFFLNFLCILLLTQFDSLNSNVWHLSSARCAQKNSESCWVLYCILYLSFSMCRKIKCCGEKWARRGIQWNSSEDVEHQNISYWDQTNVCNCLPLSIWFLGHIVRWPHKIYRPRRNYLSFGYFFSSLTIVKSLWIKGCSKWIDGVLLVSIDGMVCSDKSRMRPLNKVDETYFRLVQEKWSSLIHCLSSIEYLLFCSIQQ